MGRPLPPLLCVVLFGVMAPQDTESISITNGAAVGSDAESLVRNIDARLGCGISVGEKTLEMTLY